MYIKKILKILISNITQGGSAIPKSKGLYFDN